MNISLDESFRRLHDIFGSMEDAKSNKVHHIVDEDDEELFDDIEHEEDTPHEPTSSFSPTQEYDLDLTQVD